MSNAAAVNRVLLIRDAPRRAAGHAPKIRRYRLARAKLTSSGGPARAKRS